LDVRRAGISIVLLSAIVVAFESVAVEGALNIAHIDVFVVSAIPPIIGGLILLGIQPRKTRSFMGNLGVSGWAKMAVLGALVGAGVLLWFDAVARIGASKEAILGGGSSEVLFVVLLSALLLGERLTKIEAFGSVLILGGVFVVLTNTSTVSLSIGFGEIEAIISSSILGCSAVYTTHLLRDYDLTRLSGLELFFSGVVVIAAGAALGLLEWPKDSTGWLILILIGLFPAVGLGAYNSGLPRIGASLTSVLFALSGILTVGAQLVVLAFAPDADIVLPQSVPLAVVGGIVAFAGVYLLNRSSGEKHVSESAEGEI
jgi:drug/metabolite transporter (DMT)-like permease